MKNLNQKNTNITDIEFTEGDIRDIIEKEIALIPLVHKKLKPLANKITFTWDRTLMNDAVKRAISILLDKKRLRKLGVA